PLQDEGPAHRPLQGGLPAVADRGLDQRPARVRRQRRRRALGLGLEEVLGDAMDTSTVARAPHVHPEPTSFVWKYLFTTDQKMIAKQFLMTGLFFLAFGGSLAMMIRWQWAFPGEKVPILGVFLERSQGVITPATYQSIFTMHGLIMIFWA